MRNITKATALALAAAPVLLLAVVNGCGPETDLGGVELINALPDTRITGTPPYLRDTEYTVQFYWTGNDPDGRIRGFQWKMTANGDDGISIRDTLTVDPATGDTLNPWRFTTVTDSTFVVSADRQGFEEDEILPEAMQRFYQPHTLIVRAIDDQGGVDPTPAMITFTATTLAPSIRLTSPPTLLGSRTEAQTVPPRFIIGWTGTDPDYELGNPVQVRYLYKTSDIANASGVGRHYVYTKYEYDQVVDSLVTFDDPQWSDWFPYALDPRDRRQTFEGSKRDANNNIIYYIFALQAKDIAGAVSLDRGYFTSVANFRVDDSQTPLLILRERYLGTEIGTGIARLEKYIAQDQPLQFEWFGSASDYGGEIVAYRYGWDVQDLNDNADPGWEVQFGLSAANLSSEVRSFAQGLHVFTVEVIDNSGLLTRIQYFLSVVPVPEENERLPLVLIDDVPDRTSNGWNNSSGTIAYDNDVQRDAFWDDVLASSGGVSRYSSDRDVIDNERLIGNWGYRDIVRYKTLIWSARRHSLSYIASSFQPSIFVPQGTDRRIPTEAYVWLEAYQRNVGNVLLAGSGVVQNFHFVFNNTPWLYPVIYNNDDDDFQCAGEARGMSFGVREEEDGTRTIFGTLQYPYRGLGIAASSMFTPGNFYYSPTLCGSGTTHRKQNCVGTKAIIIDPEFKSEYVQAGSFPDTIFVWNQIAWTDAATVAGGGIPAPSSPYSFSQNDEYYDYNETARRAVWSPQTLPDGRPAVETMWRAMPRYDWILDLHLANADDDFTYPTSNPCGIYARDAATGRTTLNGVPIGLFSYQTVSTKPGGRADVVWGFDPHLYDHTQMKRVIRWVLGEHFGLAMTP
ncbi:MAG: hypothetical protein Q7W56_13940 [Candidatus Latescibacteria bacterium]|nr:hypothetical protein [Candidatus Latescibacterota bacterium]